MIDYSILILLVLLAGAMLATAKCLVNINEIDKRIDEISSLMDELKEEDCPYGFCSVVDGKRMYHKVQSKKY